MTSEGPRGAAGRPKDFEDTVTAGYEGVSDFKDTVSAAEDGFAGTGQGAIWLDQPPTQEELAHMRDVLGDEHADEMLADHKGTMYEVIIPNPNGEGSLRKRVTPEEHFATIPDILRDDPLPNRGRYDVYRDGTLVDTVDGATNYQEVLSSLKKDTPGIDETDQWDIDPFGGDLTPRDRREHWKGRLSGLVKKFASLGRGETSPQTSAEVLTNYVAQRKSELATEAGKYGNAMDKLFTTMGERYNKLSWKAKIGVGFGLGLGGAAFSGVSLPIAALFGSGLVAQRTFAMMSKYVQYKKEFETNGFMGRRGTEASRRMLAGLTAVGYTTLMGAAIGEAVHVASESSMGEAVHEWLKNHWPFNSASELKAPVEETTPASSGEVAPTAEAPSVQEPSVSTEVRPPSLPEVEVAATKGKGYEYMMKRMWEQLVAKGIDASQLPEGSDVRKLLEASPRSIDEVVHKLALDPKHAFVSREGVSAVVKAGARIALDSAGNIKVLGG